MGGGQLAASSLAACGLIGSADGVRSVQAAHPLAPTAPAAPGLEMRTGLGPAGFGAPAGFGFNTDDLEGFDLAGTEYEGLAANAKGARWGRGALARPRGALCRPAAWLPPRLFRARARVHVSHLLWLVGSHNPASNATRAV